MGTLIHSGHIGRLGEYCELAAADGMVSIVMVNTHGHARRVAPPGGKAPRLGTNPLAFGSPARSRPIVLDFGTSATAEGKVRVKRIAGQQCPDGWLLDSDGRPTRDPNTLYANPPGTILPMGGSQAYKGFGLAMMVEILAGAVSGGVCIRETPINPNGNCVFMLIVDPAAVGGAEHFSTEVAGLVEFVRGCPRIDPGEPIQLPGDPERRHAGRAIGTGHSARRGQLAGAGQTCRAGERAHSGAGLSATDCLPGLAAWAIIATAATSWHPRVAAPRHTLNTDQNYAAKNESLAGFPVDAQHHPGRGDRPGQAARADCRRRIAAAGGPGDSAWRKRSICWALR